MIVFVFICAMKFWIEIEKIKGDFGQIRGTVLLCPFLEGLRYGTESGYYVNHAQYGISYAEIFDVVAAEEYGACVCV
jgi:hypothetical protein